MQFGGLFPCGIFLIAGAGGIVLIWALVSALGGSRARQATRSPGRGREPGRCHHSDCNHLNNPQARFCGNCGRSLA
ncbi:MAG: hypothetical protein IID33_14415 [Planctomycetes bacterium]|nr:hypothetical protein [Planctomycetota bacterium]